jgi:hypothetical protein
MAVGDQDVAVPRAKLSRLLFLRGVERYGEQHLDLVGVIYLGYRRALVTAQNSGYDWFPPAVND